MAKPSQTLPNATWLVQYRLSYEHPVQTYVVRAPTEPSARRRFRVAMQDQGERGVEIISCVEVPPV